MSEPDAEDVALEEADTSPMARADGPAPLPPDTSWRQLHPASLAVNLVPQAWGVVRNFWPLLLAMLFTGGLGGEGVADLFIVLVFFGLATGRTVVHFLTLRYRMAQGRLEIRDGLFNRNMRVIDPAKVQNVETVRNVFHRLSGLVEVRIETASGDEVEGLLSALTEDEAERLVASLDRRPERADEDDDAPLPAVAHNDTWDLLRYGMTSTRIGTAVAGMFVLYEVLVASDAERTAAFTARAGAVGLAAIFLALAIAGWIGGIATSAVRHHGFTLLREHDALVAQQGLLTKRRVRLRLHKVQRISVREPWLRRLFGIASVVIETASGRAGSGGTERSTAMVPVVRPHDVDALVREALPRIDVPLAQADLLPPNRRALLRGLIRGAIQGTLLAAVVIAWWQSATAVAAAVVLWPVPAWLAWLDWRHQGWRITDEVVVSRRGYLNRVTTIVARDKLQSVDLDQGPLQRRYALGEVLLRVAGSGVVMPQLDHDEAFTLAVRLSSGVGSPPGAPAP